jgi:LAS superfamily LD-carboxypeptidase LdcB
MEVTKNRIYGLDEKGLIPYSESILLSPKTLSEFKRLQEKAEDQGIQLEIVSGFRSFNRQLLIWNNKAKGERPLLDENGDQLDFSSLSPIEIVHAILRWSALPGGSRHHWGTDFDVYDAKAITKDELQLIPSEYEPGGDCEKLGEFLNQELSQKDCAFFRPYSLDLGGVGVEPWHLSFKEESKSFLSSLDIQTHKEILKDVPIVHKDIVLSHLDEIYATYILNITD